LKEQGYLYVNLDFAQKVVCKMAMNMKESELSPPLRLAISYARADLRDAFTLILKFDNRIADIVGRSTEPMIAQMKIAWWYDAIGRQADMRPAGEPILQELGTLDADGLTVALQQILDAWGLLLSEDDWLPETLQSFAEVRSDAVFGSYARWVGDNLDCIALGQQWALADLHQRFGRRVTGVLPQIINIPKDRKLRPLTILALAANNPNGIRMIWHALTGR
jgi:15-cis-phytoene synthase